MNFWKKKKKIKFVAPNSTNTYYVTKFLDESGVFKVACKGQLASLKTPECHLFQRTDKIICTHRFVLVDGKRIGKKIQRKGRRAHLGSPPPSLFNQRRKTDMSNHNKTSSGKWAFAITVSQPPLERPPFLDINQRFMDWFPHSLFNYSYFFIYLTTEDFLWGLITSLLAITFLLLVYVSFFFFFSLSFIPFLVVTLFLCSVPGG